MSQIVVKEAGEGNVRQVGPVVGLRLPLWVHKQVTEMK